jgi:hypothetical protein
MTIEREPLLERLTKLPDYPAIRDITNALWGMGEIRGAAVMVGSGFTRNAEQTVGNAVPPPLWSDFARRMAHDLYPATPGKEHGDALRLAEEYRAALGQPALDALIRELVPDRQWEPGPLHRELLRLPWADVLTTNWDTLLERAAAEDHDRAYEVVETVEAIARTRAPRIVKLHGSLPSHGPFILAEEDFRTYPDRFAPFVNLAQQVLLENELVLLGFSGDDPNFLRWAGWVRDQLGASARRIRLIGVLGLTSSRRRLLEGQNVTPIDLAPFVEHLDQEDRHRVATEIFLGALKAGRPKPRKDWHRPGDELPDVVTEEDLAGAWAEDRRNYPGWLVAPHHQRYRLRWKTERIVANLETRFPELSPALRARLAVEAAWRCSVSLDVLPSWLIAAVPEIATDADSGLTRNERSTLQLARAFGCR